MLVPAERGGRVRLRKHICSVFLVSLRREPSQSPALCFSHKGQQQPQGQRASARRFVNAALSCSSSFAVSLHPSATARAARCPLHLALPCPVPWLLASPAREGTFLPKSQASKSLLPLGSPGCCLPSLSCIYLPSLQSHRGKPCRFPPANTAPLL